MRYVPVIRQGLQVVQLGKLLDVLTHRQHVGYVAVGDRDQAEALEGVVVDATAQALAVGFVFVDEVVALQIEAVVDVIAEYERHSRQVLCAGQVHAGIARQRLDVVLVDLIGAAHELVVGYPSLLAGSPDVEVQTQERVDLPRILLASLHLLLEVVRFANGTKARVCLRPGGRLCPVVVFVG